MDNRAHTFRDFYKAPDSDEQSEDEVSNESSEDSDARSTGSWHHPALKKKSDLMNKKQQYANQLKRAMPAREINPNNKYDTSR